MASNTPIEREDIMLQFPQDDPIPFSPRGDIRHIQAFMKSVYGDAITLLTPELFESLKGQTVFAKYFTHGQEVQRTMQYVFPLHIIGSTENDATVRRLVGELIQTKKVPKYKLIHQNLVRLATRKNEYFTLASVICNYIDHAEDEDGVEQEIWLNGSEAAMCPSPQTLTFVFLKP